MKIEIFDEIDSTNTYLKNLKNKEEYQIAISKIQTSGRGRTGNKWESQSGGAYFSFAFKQRKDIVSDEYNKLPLVVGYSLLRTLEKIENGIEFKFKWTNDIYAEDKKISGILVEKRDDFFIVGIGINLNNKIDGEAIDRGISLGMITGKEYDIEKLVKNIVQEFQKNMKNYLMRDWDNILYYLNSKNYIFEKKLEIYLRDGRKLNGIGKNINIDGEIVIEIDGIEEKFSVGEIHMKKANL